MKRAPFNLQLTATLQEVESQRVTEVEEENHVFCMTGGHKRKKGRVLEPWTDLHHTRSPSPPSSSSTLSSLGGGGGVFTDTTGVAVVSDNPCTKYLNSDSAAVDGEAGRRKEERALELHRISAALEMSGLAEGDCDTLFSEFGGTPGHEQAFFRLMMNDGGDDSVPGFASISGFNGYPTVSPSVPAISFGSLDPSTDVSQFSSTFYNNNASAQLVQPPSNVENAIFTPGTRMNSLLLSLPPEMFFQQPIAEAEQYFGPNFLSQHQQIHTFHNPPFFPSLISSSPSSELHQNSSLLIHLNSSEVPTRHVQTINSPHLHSFPHHHQQHQALVNMLIMAAELFEAGLYSDVHGILARLNQPLPSPVGKPLFRSAFYFKQALELIANSINPEEAASHPFHPLGPPFITQLATPVDVILKIDAYKSFFEVSPILQFASFTATQALLEELNAAYIIHIIDFDIGVGGEWSSFMQELAQRQSPKICLLKITAFVSPCTFHPIELHLIKENLSQFAADLNIPFEINILFFEAFDPAEILILSAGSNEAIAVNLPVGVCQCPSFPIILRHVKQLLPKIVISVDIGCNRGDLPFSHHFLHALHSCVTLLDSIDAAGTNLDVANKIEKYLLQPKIDRCISGHYRSAEKTLPWRTQFSLAGFEPLQFSDFSEMQADCLLKKLQVRGFHVEKQHSSLYLYWKRGELASVSIWRCK